MKNYLTGDSHSTAMWESWLRETEFRKKMEFETLGGGAMGWCTNPNSHSYFGEKAESVFNQFKRYEPNQNIILSYTDGDSRGGMRSFKEEIHGRLEDDYRIFFEKVIEICNPNKILLYEFYSVTNKICIAQECSVDERLENRKIQIRALENLSKKIECLEYVNLFGNQEIEDENYLVKDSSFMMDDVHYNFKNEKLQKIIEPILTSFIDNNSK